MKLLTRTSFFYFLFSLVIFIAGGVIFYHAIQAIFYRQIDDTLVTEKELIGEQINYSDSLPDFRRMFGHLIDVTELKDKKNHPLRINDTVVLKEDKTELVPCRHLEAVSTGANGKRYIVHLYKPTNETEYLITAILVAMTLLFISLIGLLLLVNYFISKRAWIGFYRTLRSLSKYSLNQEEPLTLSETTITEFRSLNNVLESMSRKIHKDYLNLKEFNENASHELQTPLAIIKSKLELLIQSEQLSAEQMNLIRSVYDAATRISRLNQGLLLISKIENNQFSETEQVDLNQLILRNIDNFDEILKMKRITCSYRVEGGMTLPLNLSLAEILVSNLFSNAVRHNVENGEIEIRLEANLFRISNTGPPLTGSPDHLFERFSKSDRTSDSVGLGLAIVRQIVNLYGFRVEYRYEKPLHRITLFFAGGPGGS